MCLRFSLWEIGLRKKTHTQRMNTCLVSPISPKDFQQFCFSVMCACPHATTANYTATTAEQQHNRTKCAIEHARARLWSFLCAANERTSLCACSQINSRICALHIVHVERDGERERKSDIHCIILQLNGNWCNLFWLTTFKHKTRLRLQTITDQLSSSIHLFLWQRHTHTATFHFFFNLEAN